MGVNEALLDDPFTLRKHLKNVGRAYREQATTLIEICRLYVDASTKTYTKNDRLQHIFQLADAALSAAGRADKGTTNEATEAFLRVQREIKSFGSPSPLANDSGSPHRKKLPDPSVALEDASKKDKRSTSLLSKVKSAFKAPLSNGTMKKVNFVILESPHVRHQKQPILHQEIDDSTTASEIIWRFSRYPKNSPWRIVLKQNPHFYVELSEIATSYGGKFFKYPLKDFAYHRINTIYVLLDKSCHLFLDTAKPRIFGNLWRPDKKVILKDVVGTLESEDIVLRDIGENQDYWHRPSPASSQVESGYSSEIVQNPRAMVKVALRSQNVDLMIRDQSMLEPPKGWSRLPHPATSVSTSSFGSSTLSATSTAVNLSSAFLGLPKVDKPPTTVGPGYSMKFPSPLPERGPQSAELAGRRARRDRTEIFPAYAIGARDT